MSYITRNFVLPPGVYQITSALLAFTDIHMISRQGVVHRRVSSDPAGRQFVHDASAGKLIFGVPGNPIPPREEGGGMETVQVTFKNI